MRRIPWFASVLIWSLLAAAASAQDDPRERGKEKAHQRTQETRVLVPADRHKEDEVKAPMVHQPQHGNPGFQASGPAQAPDDPLQPRPLQERAQQPFVRDRALLQVNDGTLRASELNEMVAHFQVYRQAVLDMHLRQAVNTLLPRAVFAARYRQDIPAMRQRIDEALAKIKGGASWADVAREYSDDTEAENPEGRYTFARERAVQPFDRHAHSGMVGHIQGPFLTVYGFHFLEVLAYHRGATPADDTSEVRHILVMFPDLKQRSEAGEDIRAFIKEQVKQAKISALEPAVVNLVPRGD